MFITQTVNKTLCEVKTTEQWVCEIITAYIKIPISEKIPTPLCLLYLLWQRKCESTWQICVIFSNLPEGSTCGLAHGWTMQKLLKNILRQTYAQQFSWFVVQSSNGLSDNANSGARYVSGVRQVFLEPQTSHKWPCNHSLHFCDSNHIHPLMSLQ